MVQGSDAKLRAVCREDWIACPDGQGEFDRAVTEHAEDGVGPQVPAAPG